MREKVVGMFADIAVRTSIEVRGHMLPVCMVAKMMLMYNGCTQNCNIPALCSSSLQDVQNGHMGAAACTAGRCK
jgi:hypothetical protein